MKALINLFAPPSPTARAEAVMKHPTELSAPELEAIQDGLKLLRDTNPEWRKMYRHTAYVKISIILQFWSNHVKEHS